jgi:hypothetical protein
LTTGAPPPWAETRQGSKNWGLACAIERIAILAIGVGAQFTFTIKKFKTEFITKFENKTTK